jgi:N-acetylglucosamine-6-phosphate deacetylase
LEDRFVAAVMPSGELPSAMQVHTLPAGAWLAPCFVDTQVNGGGDVLFNDEPTHAGIARIVAAHRQFGTTALLPTLISDTPEKMRAAFSAVQSITSADSGVLGIHFEGPFLSPEKPGAHDPAMIRRPVRTTWIC